MISNAMWDIGSDGNEMDHHPYIGVISDTHGLMRREALDALAGASLILHAGDIGKPSVLEELREIAPVIAIRGNVDLGGWASHLPEYEWVDVQWGAIYLLHDIAGLSASAAAKARVVISGHSHRPSIDERDGLLFLNPGSAGPRRFSLPITIARLWIADGVVGARVIDLGLS